MFTLSFYDFYGNVLKEGDIVKVTTSGSFSGAFYCEVKFLEAEQSVSPFHTFSFHKIEKVESVPDGAEKLSEERYNVWYTNEGNDPDKESYKDYLMSWRECEHLLEQRCWRISKAN